MYTKDEIDTTSKQNVRDNGEVFTPFKIVEEMLALVPKSAWDDPSYCFLEPTSGNGQFLVKVFEKRLKHGISIEVALNTLVGMEINPDTILDSHVRLYEVACAQMRKDGLVPGKNPWFDMAIRIVAIVHNNIFKVKDSLATMKSGLDMKEFFFEDPTGNDQVLCETQREEKLKKIKEEFRKHKDGVPSKTLHPFFAKV